MNVIDSLDPTKFDKDYIFYVVHARAHKDCQTAVGMIKKAFPKVEIQTYDLSPAFITQGGPACVARLMQKSFTMNS